MYINPIALQIPLFGHTISIHWYGVIIAVGLLLAILLAMSHMKRVGQNPDIVLDLALIVVPLAVICARAYYVIFEWNNLYAGGPFWKVFAVWEGGLAIYGAVIGGALGVFLYTRFNKTIKFVQLLDILAPSLILGQAIGRWGNFVNQEAYGSVITDPSWQWFPAAVYIQADQQYHMATFFYESMWNFLVFGALVWYFRHARNRKEGNVILLYLLLYGCGRAVIEGLRTDSLYLTGDVRVSQWLSILLVVASAAVLIIRFVQTRRAEPPQALDNSLRLMPVGETGEPEAPTGEPSLEEVALDAPAVAPLVSAPPVDPEIPEVPQDESKATPEHPL